MSEGLVYITDNLHTGNIRHASSELDKRTADIAHECTYRIGQVATIEGGVAKGLLFPLRLRLAVSQGQLSLAERAKWEEAEMNLFGVLRTAHVLQSVSKVQMKLSEFLTQSPQFYNATDMLSFFEFARDRITNLLDPNTQKKLDSLRIASYSYVESLLLRRAIFEGVYLTKSFHRHSHTPTTNFN